MDKSKIRIRTIESGVVIHKILKNIKNMDYFLIPREVVTKIPDAFGNGKLGFLKNFYGPPFWNVCIFFLSENFPFGHLEAPDCHKLPNL